jgi:hypothetical protein
VFYSQLLQSQVSLSPPNPKENGQQSTTVSLSKPSVLRFSGATPFYGKDFDGFDKEGRESSTNRASKRNTAANGKRSDYHLGELKITEHALQRCEERNLPKQCLHHNISVGKPVIVNNVVVTVIPTHKKPATISAGFLFGLSGDKNSCDEAKRMLFLDEGFKKNEDYRQNGGVERWLNGRSVLGIFDCEQIEGIIIGKQGLMIKSLESTYCVALAIFRNPTTSRNCVYVTEATNGITPNLDGVLEKMNTLTRKVTETTPLEKWLGGLPLLGSIECEECEGVIIRSKITLETTYFVKLKILTNTEFQNRSFVYIKEGENGAVPDLPGVLTKLTSLITTCREKSLALFRKTFKVPASSSSSNPNAPFKGFRSLPPPPPATTITTAKAVKHDPLVFANRHENNPLRHEINPLPIGPDLSRRNLTRFQRKNQPKTLYVQAPAKNFYKS